jgi:hypothetical protein
VLPAQHNNPEDSHLHTHRHENLKSHICLSVFFWGHILKLASAKILVMLGVAVMKQRALKEEVQTNN